MEIISRIRIQGCTEVSFILESVEAQVLLQYNCSCLLSFLFKEEESIVNSFVAQFQCVAETFLLNKKKKKALHG